MTNAVVSPALSRFGKVLRPGQDLAAALQPVLRGDSLERRDDRPFEPGHRVAPGRCGGPWEGPPVGNPRPAGEGDAAVDDQQLAVGAVVEARERIPAEALVRLDPAAGLAQPAHRRAPQAETADRIHDDRHVQSLARPIGQRVDELIGDAARLEDVALHVDRSRRVRIASIIAG